MNKINNKGYALVLVVIVVALVITLTSTMLFTLNTEIRLNQGTEEKEKANYLAQAGIEHGLMLIEKNDLTIPSTQTLLDENDKKYQYTVINLTKDEIAAKGEIIVGGQVKQSITITAIIDESGKVTIKG